MNEVILVSEPKSNKPNMIWLFINLSADVKALFLSLRDKALPIVSTEFQAKQIEIHRFSAI